MKTMKKLCEIVLKTVTFLWCSKRLPLDKCLSFVYNYIYTKMMYGYIPVGGLNSAPLP